MIRLGSLFSLFLFMSMIVLLLPCMAIYVTLLHNINIWRSSMIWNLFSSRSTPPQDTPLIRSLSASPMTVRIRGVSLYMISVITAKVVRVVCRRDLQRCETEDHLRQREVIISWIQCRIVFSYWEPHTFLTY